MSGPASARREEFTWQAVAQRKLRPLARKNDPLFCVSARKQLRGVLADSSAVCACSRRTVWTRQGRLR